MSPSWYSAIPRTTSTPITIIPNSPESPRNGRTVMISESRIEATTAPRKVARPPESAAPPSTAAVMLFSA